MKTHSSLSSLLKKAILITLLLPTLQMFATVNIEMGDNEVIVTTDAVGKTGYKGCEAEKLQLVPAYEYTLYRKEKIISKVTNTNTQTCPSPSTRWVKVAEKKSDSSLEVFLNMPRGEYKATVLSGQAIGCSIDGNTQSYPSKSIVYYQEKSNTFDLSNEPNESTLSTTNKDVLKVFPNPTSGEINIQLQDHSLKEKATIVFYDLLGKETLVISQNIEDKSFTEWKVDVSSFSGGAYLLRISDQEGNSYEKKVMVIENK